jgi:hypothetical protein
MDLPRSRICSEVLLVFQPFLSYHSKFTFAIGELQVEFHLCNPGFSTSFHKLEFVSSNDSPLLLMKN